ncbi:ead/Ea22-like family protein [Salmonella enterica]|nr:ead/Ea22-like family protein [Salmonella enterica]
MINIDKQALREEFQCMQDHYSDPADRDRQIIYIAAEALLDENIQLQREKDATEAVLSAMRDDMRQARKRLEAAERSIAEQSVIVAAAEKLVRCKGRYHSELNYLALAKLFGVITPDLPPLEHENVHYADAAEVEITALRQRIAELEKGHQEAAKQINSWRRLAKQNIAERGKDISELEAARQRIAELSKAASVNNHWKPDVCPITGRMFFMWIEHETLGYVPTYGGPFDSYTIPTRDSSGEFSCERYDHDLGGWVEGEFIGLYLIDDDEQCRVCELEERISELEARTVTLPDRKSEIFWPRDADEFDSLGYVIAVRSAIRAAGIGVKGG